MNYLAHIYLSGDNSMLKIGNFIADSVKGRQYLKYPLSIQQGISLHRSIDQFTDSHPIVHQSTHRLFPKYSHYSTVIVDILYDHFLADNWNRFSEIPLARYSRDFYNLLSAHRDLLPKRVQNFMPVMIEHNWLLMYASVEGIGEILSQMDHRTKFRSKMGESVDELRLYYQQFEEEFFAFFVELEDFCQKRIVEIME